MKGQLLALTALFVGCAHAPEQRRNPLAREAGKPASVAALGASYTVPANFDVPDLVDQPGSYRFEFVDRITRCYGYVQLETVGEGDRHERWVKEKTEEVVTKMRQTGLQVATRTEQLKLLGVDARNFIVDLTEGQDKASMSFLDHHYDDQSLSVVSYVFCDDPKLRPKTVSSVVEVVNSQKR